VYCKLVFASIQHRPNRAVRNVILIAVCLTPVLLALGLGHQAATAHSSSSARVALEALKPLFRRLASAFLIACAAITFLSMWDRVRSRKYEIGVLRFLGASKILVIAIVSADAAVVSLGGAILAVVISQSVLTWLNSVFTAAPPYLIGVKWCLAASSTAIGAAMTGSAIPCSISVQQDVREMLEWDR
jgi:putative ABC transport system permease protein